jgi:hypothetical protein
MNGDGVLYRRIDVHVPVPVTGACELSGAGADERVAASRSSAVADPRREF